MSTEIERYERIDAYLNQELSGKDLAAFEAELAWNNELKEQVELQQLTNESVIDYRLTKVKALAQSYSAKSTSSNTTNYIGGGLIVLAISGAALYFSLADKEKPAPLTSVPATEQSAVASDPIAASSTAPSKNSSQASSVTEPTPTETPAIPAATPVAPATTAATEQKKEQPVEKVTPVVATTPSKKETRTENPCTAIHIQATAQTKASCAGQQTGSLTVETISGGQAPYQFSLNGEHFTTSKTIDHLAAGQYTLQVKDHNGCLSSEKTHTVESISCQTIGKYAVSPLEGQLWKIPVDGGSAKLKIVNKAGVLIYSTDIRNGYPEEWDVKDQHNNYPEPGVYLYMLEFADGHIEQGYITIEL